MKADPTVKYFKGISHAYSDVCRLFDEGWTKKQIQTYCISMRKNYNELVKELEVD